MLRFEWDERKNRANRRKHGVWRRKARSTIRTRLFSDPEHSHEEERFILLGITFAARLLVIAHCYRETDEIVRIISARQATRKEERFYEEGI